MARRCPPAAACTATSSALLRHPGSRWAARDPGWLGPAATRLRRAMARPTASICCSPPDSSPALRSRHLRSSGSRSRTSSWLRPGPALSRRFSRVVRLANSARPSGTRDRPPRASRCADFPAMSWPFIRIRPASGRCSPAMVASVVVLPAPLAPSSATTSASPTCRVRSRTTGLPLYPASRPSTSTTRDASPRGPDGRWSDALMIATVSPQIRLDHGAAVPDLLGGARGDDVAEIDDHDAIAEAQHQAHVVVDEEHAHSPAWE